MIKSPKLIRITTVSGSLTTLLKGQLKFMNQYYHVIAICNEDENMSLSDLLKTEDVDTHAVPMTRSITPFKDLRAAFILYKFFRKEKPLIVHTHTPKAGTVGMLAAWFARVPHRLHTIAGLPLLEVKGNKRILLNTVEKITYKCSTQILPNSKELKRIILNQKFTTDKKIKVIGQGSSNGIDTSYFDKNLITESKKTTIKKELNIDERDFVFIFIGRLVTDKGVNELIVAFHRLSKNSNNNKLILVGERESDLDPLSEKTELLIKTNKNISFVGWQYDIRPFLAISKALVFPSYREGFPNVVLQASSMELPCIVSNINGCNEIIENDINGIIIPPKNDMAILNAMIELKENRKKYDRMVKNSRPLIIERYQQEYIWNELLKNYQSL